MEVVCRRIFQIAFAIKLVTGQTCIGVPEIFDANIKFEGVLVDQLIKNGPEKASSLRCR